MEGAEHQSGVYVFKTDDQDSSPYRHFLISAQASEGLFTSEIVLTYKNPHYDSPRSQVRIVLSEDKPDQVEFDVFLSKIWRRWRSRIDVGCGRGWSPAS